MIVNIFTILDVHHGLQTFSNPKQTLVSTSFGTRLRCGGIHYHLVCLMILLEMVCSSTYITHPELFTTVVIVFVLCVAFFSCVCVCNVMCTPVQKNGFAEYCKFK